MSVEIDPSDLSAVARGLADRVAERWQWSIQKRNKAAFIADLRDLADDALRVGQGVAPSAATEAVVLADPVAAYLAEKPWKTIGEIAKAIGKSTTYVAARLSSLRKRGDVVRSSAPVKTGGVTYYWKLAKRDE